MIAENDFFSKINSFLAATARSIYSSNFSHILKHIKSRGDTLISHLVLKSTLHLQGRGFSVLLLNHYVSRPKKPLTTSFLFRYKSSNIKELQQHFLPKMFLNLENN